MALAPSVPQSYDMVASFMSPELHERGNHAVWAGRGSGRGADVSGRGREFGINGGSSGKDGVITLGDHPLVFSGLRRVTCGVAVHKAVDNRCDMRITGGILWTRCGHERNLK